MYFLLSPTAPSAPTVTVLHPVPPPAATPPQHPGPAPSLVSPGE